MNEIEYKARRMLRWRLSGVLIGFVVAIILCVIYIVREPGLRPLFLVALVVESLGAVVVAIRLWKAA